MNPSRKLIRAISAEAAYKLDQCLFNEYKFSLEALMELAGQLAYQHCEPSRLKIKVHFLNSSRVHHAELVASIVVVWIHIFCWFVSRGRSHMLCENIRSRTYSCHRKSSCKFHTVTVWNSRVRLIICELGKLGLGITAATDSLLLDISFKWEDKQTYCIPNGTIFSIT